MDLMEEEDTINKINIAPLVDVCLVLVLVFMVTMPLSALYGITVKNQSLHKFGITTQQDHVMVHLAERAIYIRDSQGDDRAVPYVEFGRVLRSAILASVTHQL